MTFEKLFNNCCKVVVLMAKIKFSSLVSDVRGKIGGDAVVSGPYGHYIKRAPKPIQRYTDSATTVKAAFRYLSDRWENDMTESQRDWWRFAATINPFTNEFGDEYFISGRCLYIRQNLLYAMNGYYSYVSDTSGGTLTRAASVFEYSYDATYGIWVSSGGGSPIPQRMHFFRVSIPTSPTRLSWPSRTVYSQIRSSTVMQSPTPATCSICPRSVLDRYTYPARFFIRTRSMYEDQSISMMSQGVIDIASL